MDNARPTLADFTECIALLVKGPRDIQEIMELMEVNNRTRVAGWLHTLKAEGLVHICGWRNTAGRSRAVYAWQPSVCAFVDVADPFVSKRAERKATAAERAAALAAAKVEADEIRAARSRAIVEARRAGEDLDALAKEHSLTRTRVLQIIRAAL